jgi:hypothetical protein
MISIRLAFKFSPLFFILFAVVAVGNAQVKPVEQKTRDKPLSRKELIKLDREAPRPPSGKGFFVARAATSFTVLLCDDNSRCENGLFTQTQIDSFEAITAEATKFALNEEQVGRVKPIITRFSDKNDPTFLVDVSKVGKQTQFFLTMKSATGRLTLDAGTITRGDPNAKTLLYDMIARVAAVKAEPAQQ